MQAIIFDLFGTLVPNITRSVHDSILDQMAAMVDVEACYLRACWPSTHDARVRGRLSTAEAIRSISISINGMVSESNVQKAASIREGAIRNAIQLTPQTERELLKIKRGGTKLGLLSNCSLEVPEVWRAIPICHEFDVAVFSCEVGNAKPAACVFSHVCELLNVSASKCIYVADGNGGELSAAASLGMRTVQVVREAAEYYSVEEETWDGERYHFSEFFSHLKSFRP